MNKAQIVWETAEYVRLQSNSEGSGHDWWHVVRVRNAANYICRKEGGDAFVVELAALLHDIADHKFYDGDMEIGPKKASQWLRGQGVPDETVTAVSEIVRNVSFKGGGVRDTALSFEGMIVRDADRLDAIGAIGIARTFAFAGFKGELIYDPEINPKTHDSFTDYKNKKSTAINHFYEKLLLLKDRMHTATAKRIAEDRHKFLECYLRAFFREWESEFD
jgi:uncharacterized protein